MSNYSQQVIYNTSHNLDTLCSSGVHYQKTLSIKIAIKDLHLQVQVYDCNDYMFNYTANIDRATFDQMKLEQSLDIRYEELSGQLLDLLQHTANKDMLIRLEFGEHFCKLIFYEKIRIKSLIFLTVELQLTNQREIINEMSQHIKQLKDSNKNLLFQLNTANNEIVERDKLLKTSLACNKRTESRFLKDLSLVEKSFNTISAKLENTITDKLLILSQKQFILLRNIEAIKVELKFKKEANNRLLICEKKYRLEHDRDCQMIHELKNQLSASIEAQKQSKKDNSEFKEIVEKLQRENVDFNLKMGDLRKDLQEATFIIAQKTKTHEEMAKDLVQANSMLVNFTNHYDNLSKELSAVKTTLTLKEQNFTKQLHENNELKNNFESYKKEFNYSDLEKLKQQLFDTNKHCQDLEKQNRETNKLNALLSRKLAAGDSVDNISTNNANTKNHTPWLPKNQFN